MGITPATDALPILSPTPRPTHLQIYSPPPQHFTSHFQSIHQPTHTPDSIIPHPPNYKHLPTTYPVPLPTHQQNKTYVCNWRNNSLSSSYWTLPAIISPIGSTVESRRSLHHLQYVTILSVIILWSWKKNTWCLPYIYAVRKTFHTRFC